MDQIEPFVARSSDELEKLHPRMTRSDEGPHTRVDYYLQHTLGQSVTKTIHHQTSQASGKSGLHFTYPKHFIFRSESSKFLTEFPVGNNAERFYHNQAQKIQFFISPPCRQFLMAFFQKGTFEINIL